MLEMILFFISILQSNHRGVLFMLRYYKHCIINLAYDQISTTRVRCERAEFDFYPTSKCFCAIRKYSDTFVFVITVFCVPLQVSSMRSKIVGLTWRTSSFVSHQNNFGTCGKTRQTVDFFTTRLTLWYGIVTAAKVYFGILVIYSIRKSSTMAVPITGIFIIPVHISCIEKEKAVLNVLPLQLQRWIWLRLVQLWNIHDPELQALKF